MGTALLRVCLTGPESTGKTMLARRIAEWLGTECVPEASRVYAERKGGWLTADDVGPIARKHIALADAGRERALARGAATLVLDTDLLSTLVYARHYYGGAPRWVARAERDRRADLYLLCDVDVPWVPDGIRDRPDRRDEMFALFDRALARRRASVIRVRGEWDERWRVASAAVRNLLEDSR